MVWTVARREFLEYLASLRFILGFLIALTLTVLSTVINIDDYVERLADYTSAVREMNGDGYHVVVYRRPEVLSILVQGLDRKIGSQATLSPMEIPTMTSGYAGTYVSQQHQFVSGFPAVDVAFVVRIVLSLMVMFLAYDSIAGEKMAGTLRMVLSNSLHRRSLLIGKTIGGLMLVQASLVAAMAASFLVIVLHPSISLALSDWMRIVEMVVVSGLYLSAIFGLSVFVSVIVEGPSTAMLVLLQVWLFLVVIFPALVNLAGPRLSPLPDEKELAERKMAAFKPYEYDAEETQNAFSTAIRSGKPIPEDLKLRNDDFYAKRAEVNYDVDEQLSKAQSAEKTLVETVTIVSPSSLFDRAMIRLARTGPDEFDLFMKGIRRFWDEYIQVIRLRETDRTKPFPPFTPSQESDVETFEATYTQEVLLVLFSVLSFVGALARFDVKDVR